jgi:UDP-N-acetylmuramate dehydrogenase
MKVGGPVDLFIIPENERALVSAIRLLREKGVPYFILGNGTNVIVREGGFRGAIVRVGRFSSEIDVDGSFLKVRAGVSLSEASSRAADSGLSGMEAISGIPGSVGGALYMNAGAYDGEMAQVVFSAEVYDAERDETAIMERGDMAFSYRNSVFLGGSYVIFSVLFALKNDATEVVRRRMRSYNARRNAKQPMDLPSAGSFFRRPEGAYAGALIEKAGLKGLRVGGAMVSDKHAGFIVNMGDATATDVMKLMREIQNRVYGSSGYRLEPEPVIIGEDA